MFFTEPFCIVTEVKCNEVSGNQKSEDLFSSHRAFLLKIDPLHLMLDQITPSESQKRLLNQPCHIEYKGNYDMW